MLGNIPGRSLCLNHRKRYYWFVSEFRVCCRNLLPFFFTAVKGQFIVLQLLQTIPWLVRLGRKDDDNLIIQILKLHVMCSHNLSKKQEGQFLKLIEALMQVILSLLDGSRMANLHNRLTFILGKKNDIFYYS